VITVQGHTVSIEYQESLPPISSILRVPGLGLGDVFPLLNGFLAFSTLKPQIQQTICVSQTVYNALPPLLLPPNMRFTCIPVSNAGDRYRVYKEYADQLIHTTNILNPDAIIWSFACKRNALLEHAKEKNIYRVSLPPLSRKTFVKEDFSAFVDTTPHSSCTPQNSLHVSLLFGKLPYLPLLSQSEQKSFLFEGEHQVQLDLLPQHEANAAHKLALICPRSSLPERSMKNADLLSLLKIIVKETNLHSIVVSVASAEEKNEIHEVIKSNFGSNILGRIQTISGDIQEVVGKIHAASCIFSVDTGIPHIAAQVVSTDTLVVVFMPNEENGSLWGYKRHNWFNLPLTSSKTIDSCRKLLVSHKLQAKAQKPSQCA